MSDKAQGPSDRGETLLELLIAIMILGTAVVALASGIALSVKVSDIHRKESTSGAYVRSYAEEVEKWVAAGNYKPCAPANWYTPAAIGWTSPDASALPTGYAGTQASARTWVQDPVTGIGSWSTCGTDAGVQRVTLTVSSSDGRAIESLDVILRKP